MTETTLNSDLTILSELEYARLKKAVRAKGGANPNLAELLTKSRALLEPYT